MGASVKMVLDRNYTVRSTLGHMITFKKDQPMDIPVTMVRSCAEIGAKRVDGKDSLSVAAEEKPSQPVDPGQRLDDVRAAIEAIVERNDVDDFTAGNKPKVAAVTEQAGYKVDQNEVNRAWNQRNEELASNDNEGTA